MLYFLSIIKTNGVNLKIEMAKPLEREVNRTRPRLSFQFLQTTDDKKQIIFIICCAKKILSVVRYLTPIQVKDLILSGEQTGNIFSIRLRQGDLFSSKYLFKTSTKPNGKGKKITSASPCEDISVFSYCIKIHMNTGMLGEILSKTQWNFTQ